MFSVTWTAHLGPWNMSLFALPGWMDGPRVWASSHLLLEHLCPHCLPPYVADSSQTCDNKYSCISHWEAAILYPEGEKRRLLSPCELLFWQSAAPGHTCAVSTSPHHWFPSPPHPLRAWSCSEGILHIWQPSPCQHRFSEKGFLVGKMVMLTLTVTRDNEGCFFLIFICCAGF